MPKVVEITSSKDEVSKPDVPEKIKPYHFHGVRLDWHGKEDAIGDCPFCGREKKLRINVKTGLYRCLVCAEGSSKGGGNSYVFLRKLHEMSVPLEHNWDDLVKDRGYVTSNALKAWECSYSPLTDRFMAPAYGADGKLNQLYVMRTVEGKGRLLPTPTHHHHLHGVNLHGNKPNVIICEGLWDSLALYETMAVTKMTAEGTSYTTNVKESMLTEWDILGVPGCNVFNPSWIPLFHGKNVFILFHNDHPRLNEKTKQIIPPAGLEGARRATSMLFSGKKKPAGISYLRWGGSASYQDESLKSGYDVRDFLIDAGPTLQKRAAALNTLLSRFVPSEEKWLEEGASKQDEAPTIELLECTDFTQLIHAWKDAMIWHEGLECALLMMLATCLSTMQVGDPLWIKVYGPPGCGKSTLCEAISAATQFVLAKSTFRGFMSGFKGEGDGQDYSLISRLHTMTFVVKDGDTLLQSPNLGQILSEGRDIYDKVTRSDFKNGQGRDYVGICMSWILCGTASLRQLDDSELGARFVDVVIMDGIDSDNEDLVLLQVADRTEKNMANTVGADIESHHDEHMLKAMQLTGGYVTHLRTHSSEILSKIRMTQNNKLLCAKLGKFVAFMRARPSTRQEETAEREFAARLTTQMVRIAKCLAGVMGKHEVDNDVMHITRKVAMDTARGIVYNLAAELYSEPLGVESKALSLKLNKGVEEVKKLLRFLREIEAVDYVVGSSVSGVKGQPRWRLSAIVRGLWEFTHRPINALHPTTPNH